MTAFTSTMGLAIIRYSFDGEDFDTAPESVYFALHNDDPGDDGTENEVSAPDYQRMQLQQENWDIAGQRPTEAVYTTRVIFPEAQSDWGTITHGTIWNSSDGSGMAMYRGEPDEVQVINEGDTYEVPNDEIRVRV